MRRFRLPVVRSMTAFSGAAFGVMVLAFGAVPPSAQAGPRAVDYGVYVASARAWTMGENLAGRQGDIGSPRAIIVAWLNSPDNSLPAASTARSLSAATRRHPPVPVTAAAVKAIDTTATITDAAWFTGAYQQGVRLYVLHSTAWGTCTPWYRTQTQIALALAAGLKVAAYTRDPRCWQAGIEAAGPYIAQLQFFALDVETDPGVPVTQAMVDGVTSM